jgi:hypothetical protein
MDKTKIIFDHSLKKGLFVNYFIFEIVFYCLQ